MVLETPPQTLQRADGRERAAGLFTFVSPMLTEQLLKPWQKQVDVPTKLGCKIPPPSRQDSSRILW